ncbi:hypothetical protein ABZX85_26650 [Streptomyces sp. NPDC004539]|uniref:hypothetical protein n=1 Tax=Streptomyces sp. NPDC004539 TaxID=3154280 RepID=UPI00339E0568
MRRLLVSTVVAVTMSVGGCGSGLTANSGGPERGGTESAPPSGERARQVAAAWNGSRAAASWRAGYHPLGEWTRYPAGAENASLTLRTNLPDPPATPGRIKWPDGTSVTRPLQPASTAYDVLNRYAGYGPQLAVTSVKLGETTLPTTRGPATVPAWLFTVAGYDTPVTRAAALPSELPESPIAGSRVEQWSVSRVAAVRGATLNVIVPHGTCAAGAFVDALETPGSVVLSAHVPDPEPGPCTADLKLDPVTVRLTAPLGTRVLLEASTGLPVPYDLPNGSSPSWS